MKNKYNVEGFTFMDSTFIVNRRKVMEFATELTTRRLGLVYQIPAGTRCEAFDQELAYQLEKSGLKNFALAPESGSEEILKAVKKQVDLSKLLDVVRYILKTKMTIGVFIVIGFPEDTKETLKATLKLIRKLALLGAHDVTVSKFTPYPGSPYFQKFMREGRVNSDYQSATRMINFFDSESVSYCDKFTNKQLHRYMLWFFINFYVLSFIARPGRVLQNFIDYFGTGVENTRYMRMFTELFKSRKQWANKRQEPVPAPTTIKEHPRQAA